MIIPKNEYVGNRYAPKHGGTWDNTKNTVYESLVIVLWQGNSFTSKKSVPQGIDITNEIYWVKSADYNEQMAIYQENVNNYHTFMLEQLGIIGNDFININESLATNATQKNSASFDIKFPPIPLIGAKGDGITDETVIINSLLLNAFNNGYRKVVFPKGLFMIKPDGNGDQYAGLILQSDTTYELLNGAEIRSIATSSRIYSMLNISNKNNIKIVGGTITGDRNNHIGVLGEWGYGISIVASSNITLDNIWVQNCWGDGIYIGEAGTEPSTNIVLNNCTSHNNRRNGIAITNARDVTFFGGRYINTNGTEPQFGVDIEVDAKESYLDNINLYNVYTGGNVSGGIQIVPHFMNGTSKHCNINIFGGKSENDGTHGSVVFVNGASQTETIYGKINVYGYISNVPKSNGFKFLNWGVNSPKVNLKDCVVVNPSYGKLYTDFITNSGFVVDIATTEADGVYGNICFDNCGCIDTQASRTLMFPICLNVGKTTQTLDKISVINPYSKNSLTEDTRSCQWEKGKGNVIYNPPITQVFNTNVLATTADSLAGVEITASATINFSLPKANDCIDREFIFKATTNIPWYVSPDANDRIYPTNALLANGSHVTLNTIGDYLKIKSIGNNAWIVLNLVGDIHG